VYLRGYNVSPFSVTIRDTTGLSSIKSNPVRISTIGSAKFIDGTSLYSLNQPYGLVNLTLRNSNAWQINHTSGQLPGNSAANLGLLSVNTAYVDFFSTAQKHVGTYNVENLTTPNSISITGPFIVSNLSTPGFVLLEQNLNVYGNVRLNAQMDVSTNSYIASSFTTRDLLPVNGNVRVYSSVGVGGTVTVAEVLQVKSTLFLASTVQVDTLQLTQSTNQGALVAGNVSLGNVLSTLGSLSVGKDLVVGGSFFSLQEVSTSGGIVRANNLIGKDSASFAQNVLVQTSTSLFSSLHTYSTVTTRGLNEFTSSFGTLGPFYTHTLSSFVFSTLGSLSTNRLEVQSKASITGNISSVAFQSFEFMSVGNELVTPAVLSSLGTTYVRGNVSVRENGIFQSALVSSLGVGNDLNVLGNVSTLNGIFGGDVLVRNNLFADYTIGVAGNMMVRSTLTVQGNLTIVGGSEISSFIVDSFLLSNLVMGEDQPPLFSFRVSSLEASTLLISSMRIFTPNTLTVSSTYASTTQANVAEAENSLFTNIYTNSFFAGSYSSISAESDPKFVINVRNQFLEGFSSINVETDFLQANRIEANLIGIVDFLSNVQLPFSNISAISITMSSLNLQEFKTSSFSASTFQNNVYLEVNSSITVPHLTFESQGFSPRFDVNQFLMINPTLLGVNRGLYFDRFTNRIGVNISSPSFDFDVSGLVYASNIYYSSINPLVVRSEGFELFSTILVSSSYVKNSLQYGSNGIQFLTRNPYSSSNFFEINQLNTWDSNLFGIFDFPEQSTILINSGVYIYRNQKVSFNGYNPVNNQFLVPTFDLEVVLTMRSSEVFTSTAALFESAQAKTFASPYLKINSNTYELVNTMSTSSGRLTMDSVLTIDGTRNRVGLRTLEPQTALDVRGNAYFSTANVYENFQTVYLAIGTQEI